MAPALLGASLVVHAATALDRQEFLDKVKPAVVQVLTETNVGTGTGTGFVLNTDGYIATNHHVIAGGLTFTAQQGSRSEPAELVWKSESLDLAVLRTRLRGLGAVVLAESPPEVLADVVAVGFPAVAENVAASDSTIPTFTGGIIGRSVVRGTWNGKDELQILQHSAGINKGNSGGPLMDTCGRVIGVNTSRPGVTYAPTPGGPRAQGSTAVFWASFIGELSAELDSEGISYQSDSEPCQANAAGAGGASLAGQQQADLMEFLDRLMDRWVGKALLAAAVILILKLIGFFAFESFRRRVLKTASRVRESASQLVLSRRRRRAKVAHDGPVSVNSRRLRIGRDSGMDVTLISERVSRLHAELEVSARGYRLSDRNSTNGTRVFRNGRWRPIQRDYVHADERIELGDYRTTVAQLERMASPPPAGAGSDQPGRQAEDDRPAGRVRRNAQGQVVAD